MTLGTLANNNDGTERPEKYKDYTMEDYAPFVGKSGSANQGLKPLPNAEDVDPLKFLDSLASGGHMMTPVWGYALLPDGSRQQWTQFFLTSFMGLNQFDGGGYAVTYGGYGKGPIVRRFAICKHQTVDAPGANHGRGWHPGWCRHCGMNMTYDSGD